LPTPPFTFPTARIIAFRPHQDDEPDALRHTSDIATMSSG
jgi:hypothetical protein